MNQKGGVGKTTTAAHLAHGLSMLGHRVLALDLDPQGHLAASFGLFDTSLAGADRLLVDGIALSELLQREVRPNLDLLPAGSRLGEFEHATASRRDSVQRLTRALQPWAHHYQWGVIDCPPAAGLLSVSAILAAGDLVIPISGDFLALHGFSRLLRALRTIEKSLGHTTRKHLLMTRYYPRRKVATEVRERLEHYFPNDLLKTIIREAAAVTEGPGFGKTVFEYSPRSIGAEDYHALVEELLSRT
jgi:chromosome partitioning protein